MAKYDVLVFGDYFLDLVFTGLPQLPELGKEIFSTGFDMLPGGAYNTAAAMHRLGLKVGWATDFGDDDFSRFVLAQAAAEGLSDALFVHHRRPLRRVTVAASYPEDRAFIAYMDPEPAVPAAMKALTTASARAVYLSGIYFGKLFDAGLLLLRGKRMKLFMDGNSDEEATLRVASVRKTIANADLFTPNADEARRLTGEDDLPRAIRMLAELGPQVVVKDGSRGAYAYVEGEIIHAPAIAVTPLDTTGAGDCFNAGYIKAWLSGLPAAECLRWGNVVGGLSTTMRGGASRVVTAAEVERYLRRTGSAEL